ncbi:hypothetical protein AAHB34_15920 [Paenarthrobacter ureafaciens]
MPWAESQLRASHERTEQRRRFALGQLWVLPDNGDRVTYELGSFNALGHGQLKLGFHAADLGFDADFTARAAVLLSEVVVLDALGEV